MSDDIEDGVSTATPVWAAFGDLMSVMLGAFVLILVGVVGVQMQLSAKLSHETQQRQQEMARRKTLEQALAAPLAAGRVTLINGRIGINGSVLFEVNSDQLQPQGQALLKSLVPPLTSYLQSHDEILMISGFADDRQVRRVGNARFTDNWELSAQRALTVTRAFIDAGIPAASVFAAAFGSEQPVSSNDDDAGRAKNRRVEIAAVPRPSSGNAAPGKTSE
ncbi:OmpA family protein [Robbsia sp. KACC 23696]|uniref:OmpA family protein n=1 Tax=Robbsia sp. KACC 23696 TaxID=3149231 RepID=UPI00325AC6C6